MPVCYEDQIYLNFVDVVQFDIFCTIKEAGLFILNIITKAH